VSRSPADEETLQWVESLRHGGDPVALTRLEHPFDLTSFFRRYTQEPIRVVLPASTLTAILLTVAHEGLDGGLLEGLGRLLAANVKIYAVGAKAASAEGMDLPAPLGHLYRYLLEAGWVVPIG